MRTCSCQPSLVVPTIVLRLHNWRSSLEVMQSDKFSFACQLHPRIKPASASFSTMFRVTAYFMLCRFLHSLVEIAHIEPSVACFCCRLHHSEFMSDWNPPSLQHLARRVQISTASNSSIRESGAGGNGRESNCGAQKKQKINSWMRLMSLSSALMLVI